VKKLQIAALAALSLTAAPLQAQPVNRTCTPSVGALPTNAFGGDGIPVNNSQITTCTFGSDAFVGLTLGLRAHQRGTNTAVTYAGGGRYLAAAGQDVSTGPVAVPGYATWNFGFYVAGANRGSYSYRLTYDFNGAIFNQTDLGTLVWNGTNFGPSSWNLGMGFLGTSGSNALGSLIAPTAMFNRNIGGEYTFTLEAFDATNASGQPFASTAMIVTTSAVPEPSTFALMAAGLAGLFAMQRRRRV